MDVITSKQTGTSKQCFLTVQHVHQPEMVALWNLIQVTKGQLSFPSGFSRHSFVFAVDNHVRFLKQKPSELPLRKIQVT